MVRNIREEEATVNIAKIPRTWKKVGLQYIVHVIQNLLPDVILNF